MKTLLHNLWALGLVAFLAFSGLTSQQAQARPGDRVSFQVFYDQLSPHGRWIQDAEYGYVWSPRVERDFQPYASRGHWVMTEYGNTWVSDYDWGWAPFHYGRWVYDDYDGWLWIPGNEWGPAWVDWRHSNGYYGWAPMGPRVTYIVPVNRWVFVPVMYISRPRIYSYCVPRTRVVNIYHNTTIINNYYERDNRKYVYGPRTQDIERATNRKVTVHRVSNDSRPGRTSVADNSVRIYRPEVETSRREREAPAQVEARDRNAVRSTLTDTGNTSGRRDRTTLDRSGAGSDITTTRTSEATAAPTGTRTRTRTESVPATRDQETSPAPVRERESGRRMYPAPGTAQPTEQNTPQPRTRTSDVNSTRPARSTEPAPRPEGSYSPRGTREAPSQAAPVSRSRSEVAPAPRSTPAPRSEAPASSTGGGRRTRN
ncbi:DUF6600 domain-containing protein [Rufibacter sp. LB8]|uniref:DUF6600 domain-containing protein n=1 Tax=Rufibacter sp. LB8 TaxID=2777781 RepID=UPI00178C775A|nr:DUF6600 domain-containing protein [Rufibacter sp. LB8]